ncbi:hypothetical protein NL676_026347 [Syzygium grande]|nr:hypothetical protein NL676_026347 [Syzygium grande]
MINNELCHPKYGFDFIIWVEASSQVNGHSIQDEDSIQDAIRKTMHIQDEYSIQDAIRKRLYIKDGIWDKWSRDERVHHLRQNLITKKFVLLIDGVWQSLDLSKIGVPPLISSCHQEIQDLAKDIAEECRGLPLVLITVWRAMAGKDNPRLWRHMLTVLRSNPHNLPGLVENVYCVLGFRYINLMDPTYQACFLYCCLFPENYPIITDKLTELWIGEDLQGSTNDVYSLRDQGECVLGILKTACLLESGIDLNREYVKMHSVIRKMATWIARDYGKRENKLLVIEKEEDMSAGMISKWGEAEKVSLWDDTIVPFKIPTGAIANLPLNVFSQWSLSSRQSGQENEEEIVEELGRMEHLTDLSIEVFNFGSALNIFKSLNIQRSIRIVSITNWADLTVIPISYTPAGSISFSLLECGLSDLSWPVHAPILRILTVKDCDSMEKIIREGITLEELVAFKTILISRIPRNQLSSKTYKHLRPDSIFPSGVSFHMLPSLVEVCVKKCGLSDLSWLLHAPKLRKLTVEGCESMEKIIRDGIVREEVAASGLFSWVSFRICRCPSLRKLPFDSNSVKGSFSIIAEADWWPKFEWDDDTQVTFALESSPIERVEKLKFGEAVRKMGNQPFYYARIRFCPSGPTGVSLEEPTPASLVRLDLKEQREEEPQFPPSFSSMGLQ